MKTEPFHRSVLVGVAVVVLAGCATHQQFEENMKSWLGEDVNALINEWGPPSREYEMPNGNVQYSYVFEGNTVTTANQVGDTVFVNTQQNRCIAIFIVDDDVIVGYQWKGNCRA